MTDDGEDRRIGDELGRDVHRLHSVAAIISVDHLEGTSTESAASVDLLDGELDAAFVHYAVGFVPVAGGSDENRSAIARAGGKRKKKGGEPR